MNKSNDITGADPISRAAERVALNWLSQFKVVGDAADYSAATKELTDTAIVILREELAPLMDRLARMEKALKLFLDSYPYGVNPYCDEASNLARSALNPESKAKL